MRDSEKDIASEVGHGMGKAFGVVLVLALRLSLEAAKVFVAIWLLTYFNFLPL